MELRAGMILLFNRYPRIDYINRNRLEVLINHIGLIVGNEDGIRSCRGIVFYIETQG